MAVALEFGVGFYGELDDEVAGFRVLTVVAFAGEKQEHPGLAAARDADGLGGGDGLQALAAAAWAGGFYYRALALAGLARHAYHKRSLTVIHKPFALARVAFRCFRAWFRFCSIACLTQTHFTIGNNLDNSDLLPFQPH